MILWREKEVSLPWDSHGTLFLMSLLPVQWNTIGSGLPVNLLPTYLQLCGAGTWWYVWKTWGLSEFAESFCRANSHSDWLVFIPFSSGRSLGGYLIFTMEKSVNTDKRLVSLQEEFLSRISLGQLSRPQVSSSRSSSWAGWEETEISLQRIRALVWGHQPHLSRQPSAQCWVHAAWATHQMRGRERGCGEEGNQALWGHLSSFPAFLQWRNGKILVKADIPDSRGIMTSVAIAFPA